MGIGEDREPLRLAVPAQPAMPPKPLPSARATAGSALIPARTIFPPEAAAVATRTAPKGPSVPSDGLDAGTVTGWISTLAAAGTDAPDPARIDLVHALEVLKAAAAALQVRVGLSSSLCK